MGEARRRDQAYVQAKQQLLSEVVGDARIVADSAIALFERFIFPKRYVGGCYLTTMVLHRFLAEERGIRTRPVVGYVNDGTDDIMISHAWLEHGGLKTDLALHLTEHAHAQLPGAMLVLDRPLRPGRASYSYHLELTAAGIAENERMRREPELAAIVRHKEEERRLMQGRAADPASMASYINSAPAEVGYAAMTATLR